MKLIINNFKNIKFIDNFFTSFLLIIFYISESIGKIGQFYHHGNFSQKSIKAIAIVYFIYIIVNSKFLYILYLLGLLLSLFIISQITVDGLIYQNLIYFSKFIFPILLFTYFNFKPLSKKAKFYLFKTFESLILFNSILVCIGFIFNLEIFETYLFSSRFGYNGLFVSSGTSTYVYIISLYYFLVKWDRKCLINWEVIIILCAFILVGTKSMYFVLIMTVLYLLLTKTKKYKLIYTSLFLLIVSLSTYVFFYIGSFKKLTESKGLLTSILSYRDELFLNNLVPFIKNEWSFVNYLIGGVRNFSQTSQMEFIDIFFVFGLIGSAFYLWLFYKTYFTYSQRPLSLVFIILLLIIMFLSGNFFSNACVPIYLFIIKERFISDFDISSKKYVEI